MEDLTEKQEDVLAYISACIVDDQRPPTAREIAEHFGWKSVTAAVTHLQALQAKGAIDRDPNVSRGIKVTHKDYLI